MITLVFDTCFNKTYIVLRKDDKILDSIVIESNEANYHSVYLIPQIRDLLQKHSMLVKDVDAIGVNIGPGSFTGIRAGITIARVIAQQANLKLVGINSLQILSKLNKSDKNTVVVTDARKNKVYFALYNKNEELVAPMLLDKDELVSKISDEVIVCDNSIFEFLNQNGISAINYENNDSELGLFLDELVNITLKTKQDDFHWAKVKPMYIQPPSISKPKELKNV